MGVEPIDGLLQSTTGVEAGGAGVTINIAFNARSGGVNLRPFGLEECEVGHPLIAIPLFVS